MREKPAVYKFLESVGEEIKYDINSYHWLLAVTLFLLGYQIFVSWSLTDIRDGISAVAASEEKAAQDVSQLAAEISALRNVIADIQRNGTPQPRK